MVITAFNPSTDPLEKTYLAQSYPLGVVSVEAKNSTGFILNDRIMIGEMGQEKTEVVTVSNVNANGTTLTIGTTLYPHEANSPITKLQFDQVKFYRSTTGINGTYNLLTTVSLNMDDGGLVTTYDDTSAQTGYYYKIAMFHSLFLIQSTQGDAMPGITGWAPGQVGYTVDQILREINDPTETLLSRAELLGYFNDVNDDLLVNVAKPYRFLYTRNVYDRTANRSYLSFPTDSNGNQTMWKFDRLDYRFVDNTTTPVTDTTNTLEVVDLAYLRNRHADNTVSSTTVDDVIQEVALNNATNAFDYSPPSKTTSTYGCFYLYYWQNFTRITTEGQTFQTYSSRIYRLYALAKYYYKRSVTEPGYLKLASIWDGKYAAELSKYKSHDRRDAGTPRRFSSENSVTKSFRR